MSEDDSAIPSDWPGLELAYEEAKARVAVQDAQVSALDTKANVGLGSATIISVIVTLQQSILEPQEDLSRGAVVISGLATVLALVAFLVVIGASYKAYALRQYWVSPSPESLRNHYIYLSREPALSGLTDAKLNDLVNNRSVIEDRAFWTKVAIAALAVEAVALLLLAIARVVG